MPESRNACLQEYAKDALYWKLSFFSKNPIFAKYTNTIISNTVPKPVSNIFEINLKIN